MVRIVVSSAPPGGLDAAVDFRFARCAFFTVIDVDNGKIREVKAVANTVATAPHGAGIQAVQLVSTLGANVVITGNVGPNAFMALQQIGIQVFSCPPGITVRDAVQKYLAGELPPITGPTGPGHMGMGPGMGRGRGAGMGRGMGRGRWRDTGSW